MIERAAHGLDIYAVQTADDIGMQRGPLFSPAIFRAFFRSGNHLGVSMPMEDVSAFCDEACSTGLRQP